MRNIYYWALFLFFSFGITIVGQLLFREYRLSHLVDLNGIGTVEFVFSVVFLPICLATIHSLLNKRFQVNDTFMISLFLAIIVILFSSRLDFYNWWDTEGKAISMVDAEVRDLIYIGLTLQFLLATISTIIVFFIFRARNKPSGSAGQTRMASH